MSSKESLEEALLNNRINQLEQRLVAGAVYNYINNIDNNSSLYKELETIKGEGLININYLNPKGVVTKISIDRKGYIRGESEKNSIYIDTKLVINSEMYINGKKVQFLENVFNSLFDDFGINENYDPAEVMGLMKSLFNVNFDNLEPGKIYINPSTFRTVFNSTKKKCLAEHDSSFKDYKAIKSIGTALLREAISGFNADNFEMIKDYVLDLMPLEVQIKHVNFDLLTNNKAKLEFDSLNQYKLMPADVSLGTISNIIAILLNYDSNNSVIPMYISGMLVNTIKSKKIINLDFIKNELAKDDSELLFYLDYLGQL
ncbi:Uncharacterised protein [Candidatus Tiddalikarchaeum anstoanum]|nr:Uncharacterised protein [Candidatus Tiddalikarchaeum anstoanum]